MTPPQDEAAAAGPTGARRNVELKARLAGLAPARAVAQQLATESLGRHRQLDTYFHCPQGRLKLRECNTQAAELIWYTRPDLPGSRTSQYYLVPVATPQLLKQLLTAAFGVRTIVDKQREIYLYHNVRIHLDEVQGLGCFLEFEAVLDATRDAATGAAQVADLQTRFGIRPADILPGSYAELRPDQSRNQ